MSVRSINTGAGAAAPISGYVSVPDQQQYEGVLTEIARHRSLVQSNVAAVKELSKQVTDLTGSLTTAQRRIAELRENATNIAEFKRTTLDDIARLTDRVQRLERDQKRDGVFDSKITRELSDVRIKMESLSGGTRTPSTSTNTSENAIPGGRFSIRNDEAMYMGSIS